MLTLLFLKHFYIDFVNQTQEEVNRKGIFGDLIGIGHSVKHGLLTFAIILAYVNPLTALTISIIEIIIHYLTDWTKMNYGCKDINDRKFWVHLGLDQLVHSLTYINIYLYITQ